MNKVPVLPTALIGSYAHPGRARTHVFAPCAGREALHRAGLRATLRGALAGSRQTQGHGRGHPDSAP